jgi:hypothetical protein
MRMGDWARVFLVASGAISACSADSSNDAGAGDAGANGAATDGAPTIDGAAEQVTATALVIGLVGRNEGFGFLTIHEDGTITDTGVRLASPSRPKAVTFSADGRTALAAYGEFPDDKHGILVISLEPDGSEAEVIQRLNVEGPHSPTAIMFTSEGEAVMTMAGPDSDYLLVTVRKSGDRWEVGPKVACSKNAIEIYGVGVDGQALLLQTSLLDGESAARPIARREDGGWEEFGDGADFGTQYTFQLAVTSSGDRAYRSWGDWQQEDPPGELTTLARDAASGDWSVVGDPVPLPDFSLSIVMSPAEDLLVLFDDNNFTLETLVIDPSGEITLLPDRTQLDEFAQDPLFSPWGSVVVPGRSGLVKTLRAFRRGDDAWIETDTFTFDELEPFWPVWISPGPS